MLIIEAEFTPGENGFTGPNPSGISLDKANLETVAKFFDNQHDEFVRQCNIVHRKSVFQGLIYLIRIVNVMTGRLRASFTPFMEKYGFTKWMNYIGAVPLGGGHAPKIDAKAIKEGQGLGEYVDQPMDTTIGTNVVYAPFVDAKASFIARLLVWLDKRYNANFEAFLEESAKAGIIQHPDPNDEGGGI
jgi:hypothetical protein